MKNALRIIAVMGILGGGTFFFREWTLKEFNFAFAPVDASFEAAITKKQVATAVLTLKFNTASTSEDVLATTTPVTYTGPDNFLFTAPRKNAVLYHGCTYPISWIASSSIDQLSLSVTDVGARKTVEVGISGLPKEITGDGMNSVLWKVGDRLWPGEYFFHLISLNNKEVSEKSYRFVVKALPDTTPEDQKDMCSQM